MILIKVFIICVCFTNVFCFLGLQHSYRFLFKDLNLTTLENVSERSIEQPLDHFDENEKRTWKMRYFENHEFWREGGPVYLFIGGEGEAHASFISQGIIYELAEETYGALYMSEHRYYGKSKPFPEINTKNFAYLSSQQALADIVKLLKTIKSIPQYNASKVVLVGGSYPGNLAAWMRLLYPNLVDAAISSSAPVLAKVDFYEYLETVGNDYDQYGTHECYNKIASKFNRYHELLQTSAGIDQLKKEENICEDTDMSKSENQETYFFAKAERYMGSAQYGNPETIKSECSQIDNIYKPNNRRQRSVEEYFELFDFDLWNEERACADYSFDNLINSFRNSTTFYAWIYQTCTEFGYFQTTTSDTQPFTRNIPVKMYYRLCLNLYGPAFNKTRVEEGIKKTNEIYGGLSPKVSQVVFVNGDMDPWHKLGVLKDLSKNAPARLVHGTSHCRDLESDSPEDPKEMVETRKYVKQMIKKWIAAN